MFPQKRFSWWDCDNSNMLARRIRTGSSHAREEEHDIVDVTVGGDAAALRATTWFAWTCVVW